MKIPKTTPGAPKPRRTVRSPKSNVKGAPRPKKKGPVPRTGKGPRGPFMV